MNEKQIIDYLGNIGIKDVKEVVHNPSYDQLYRDETGADLQGFEQGFQTELGAVNVFTGVYTGRSPKDKFIVNDETTETSLWWNGTGGAVNDNKPITPEVWGYLKGLVTEDLEQVAKEAQNMEMLSQDASWKVLQTAEYMQRSDEFRRSCKTLLSAAKKGNLDGATLAYVKVTLQCVDCHKYVRRVRHAQQDQPLRLR